MKKLLCILLLVSGISFGQNINDYNYVIIPTKFSFFDEPNRFNLNSLSKMFMEKNGFISFFDDAVLPDSAAKDQCKLYLDVVKNSNMFTTKLTVVLKDCRNAVVFTSAEGKSTEKDYRVAYTMALREAFKSFDNLDYQYNGSQFVTASVNAPAAPQPPLSPVVKKNDDTTIIATGEMLNAQPIKNGYQLVDTTPKIALKIYKTSVVNVYVAENETEKGIVLKNNGQWIFEYYQRGKLVTKPLNIKF